MQKVWKRAAKIAGVLFAGLLCALLVRGFIDDYDKNDLQRTKRHHLEADFLDLSQLNDVPLDPDNEKWLKDAIKDTAPGTLVCARKKPRLEDAAELKVVAKDENVRIAGPDVETEPPKALNKRKGSISQLSPTRALGCCPPGDPYGVVYRPGSACCVNRIFDVSVNFCCMKNASGRILPLSAENLDYCYPDVPFCRLQELEMERRAPMSYECRNNSNKTPEFCKFACPKGSRPKGNINSAKCLKNGVWNKTPECCVGCSKNIQLDVWFLIQVPKTPAGNSLGRLRMFLTALTSYLPISLETVRVGFDLIGSRSQIEVVWDLSSHNSNEEVNGTIEKISFNGHGTKTGEALSWLAKNGFKSSVGDREKVENIVIVVLYDASEDSIFEGARLLKERSKVIVVAVGNNVSDEDLSAIASGKGDSYRAEVEEDLNSLSVDLHENICGADCLRP